MPRDSNGVYTLPTGNPVVSATQIASSWANNTMSDIGTALTGSLSRNGSGGMQAPLLLQDGSNGLPTLSFSSNASTGIYRDPTGPKLSSTVNGIRKLAISPDSIDATVGITSPGVKCPTATVYVDTATGTANPANPLLPGNAFSTLTQALTYAEQLTNTQVAVILTSGQTFNVAANLTLFKSNVTVQSSTPGVKANISGTAIVIGVFGRYTFVDCAFSGINLYVALSGVAQLASCTSAMPLNTDTALQVEGNGTIILTTSYTCTKGVASVYGGRIKVSGSMIMSDGQLVVSLNGTVDCFTSQLSVTNLTAGFTGSVMDISNGGRIATSGAVTFTATKQITATTGATIRISDNSTLSIGSTGAININGGSAGVSLSRAGNMSVSGASSMIINSNGVGGAFSCTANSGVEINGTPVSATGTNTLAFAETGGVINFSSAPQTGLTYSPAINTVGTKLNAIFSA